MMDLSDLKVPQVQQEPQDLKVLLEQLDLLVHKAQRVLLEPQDRKALLVLKVLRVLRVLRVLKVQQVQLVLREPQVLKDLPVLKEQ
jgi:hypothetical protein